jgi:AcrR family transcriptional regulator
VGQASQKPLPDPRRRARQPQGSKRYHHGDLSRALLSAALAIVESRGSEALTLRAAARLAGVSQTAPYRHFANKEAILAAVAEEGFRSLMAAMAHAAVLADSPLQRLRAVGLAYVTFATHHSSHFRVMFGREMADRSASTSLRQISTDTFNVVVGGQRSRPRIWPSPRGPPSTACQPCWSTGCSIGRSLRWRRWSREIYSLGSAYVMGDALGRCQAT